MKNNIGLAVTGLLVTAGGFLSASVVEPVPFTKVHIDDGFWSPRLETNRKVTIPYCFEKCEQTGRISNFSKAGGLMEGDFEGIYFNDSDLYKVIEGAAYSLSTYPDPELEKYVDGVIDKIASAQWEDGYLYTFYSLPEKQPEKRWTNVRDMHELYCAGHFFEAAVAYYQATGKRKILDVAIRLADYIDSVFGPGKKIDVPGHQEIEIGLVRLYRLTGEERYLKLAKFFLDKRGRNDERKIYGQYCQDHLPVIKQTDAVGHAVRAGYMYCGMADVAALTDDRAYIDAIDTIWQNVVSKKQYLTGGVGARHSGEAFGDDYELPNESAYNETCAAIANAMWNHRLFLLHGDAKYIDVLERVLYNGFLSGVSLEGNSFFYPNPLASSGNYQRSEWFGCSCCPVNVARFVPSIPGYIYGVDDDSVYINLFVQGTGEIELADRSIKLIQKTKYPWQGDIDIIVEPDKPGEFNIMLRIPGWAQGKPMPGNLYRYTDTDTEPVSLKVNGKAVDLKMQKGFAVLGRKWKSGDKIELGLPMPVHRVLSDAKVKDDTGRGAVERGPVVYCAEGIDNDDSVRNLVVADDAKLTKEWKKELLGGITVLKSEAVSLRKSDDGRKILKNTRPLTLIPYYAWAHRGPGQMAVWLAREESAAIPLPAKTVAGTSKVSASHVWGNDTGIALNDQIEPKNSNDHEIPRLTWWDHQGTTEWVQYDFEKPAKVNTVEVYWFDDTGVGSCRVPKSWKLLYKKGAKWIEVKTPDAYGVEKDKYNRTAFEPVVTDGLRIEVQLQENFSSGILEWKVTEEKKTWAGVDELPVIEELPDPFLMNNGSRVSSLQDWMVRREEIKDILLHYQYGYMPPAPGNVKVEELSSETVYDGTAIKKNLLLSMGPGNKIKMKLLMLLPKGDGPFPVIVRNHGQLGTVPVMEEIVKRGYILAEYDRTDIDPDKNDTIGSAQAAYPDYDWATLSVWAWGGMRVIDYLLTLDFVDKDKIVFTGHSRGGKTALLAGALDERIAIVVPNGSGCGGSGCYRIMGPDCETLDDITKPDRFSYWFAPAFREFAEKENKLPFDQHFLKALVAPRALLTTDALGDLWANPYGTQVSHSAAAVVFNFLGASDKIGMHFREGGHAQNEQDWFALLDFADKIFFGRNVEKKFDKVPFDLKEKHFSWSAPSL